MTINVNKEYYHIRTKMIYEVLCIDNNVLYMRKLGGSLVSKKKYPITQISLTDFEKSFNIY